MVKRSYQQYCGLAAALDLLGERWTVLIIRDLLVGPKRFTDLLDRLPGIGTGLLSQRLRSLDRQMVEAMLDLRLRHKAAARSAAPGSLP